MITFTHKRGDSFSLTLELLDNGLPVDLEGYALHANMYDRHDELVENLSVSVSTDPMTPHQFTLGATALRTVSWRPGNMRVDVEITTPGGLTTSSDTIGVQILPDVTRVLGSVGVAPDYIAIFEANLS